MLKTNVIPFLTELNKNNNREWFAENKKWYQQSMDDFKLFIDELIQHLAQVDGSLLGLSAKDCVYRIYRDVRFSKNKAPYKINFGASISPGGRKSNYAGFYIHVEPTGTSITGGGIYQPQPTVLKALRTEFYKVPDELIDIINDNEYKKYFKQGLWAKEKLKIAPKGFPKDFEHIDLLRYKHYIAMYELSKAEILSSNLIVKLTDIFGAMYPLNRLMNSIIDDMGEQKYALLKQ